MPVKKCQSCKPHPYQDKVYGDKMRVYTTTNGKEASKSRCTVCGKEQGK